MHNTETNERFYLLNSMIYLLLLLSISEKHSEMLSVILSDNYVYFNSLNNFSHPIDVVKTRLQVSGDGTNGARNYKALGIRGTVSVIATEVFMKAALDCVRLSQAACHVSWRRTRNSLFTVRHPWQLHVALNIKCTIPYRIAMHCVALY